MYHAKATVYRKWQKRNIYPMESIRRKEVKAAYDRFPRRDPDSTELFDKEILYYLWSN